MVYWKIKMILGTLLLFFGGVFISAQQAHTDFIASQVDSLIQASQACASKKDFEQALCLHAQAEKLALEAFGEKSAAYGSTRFNLGNIYYVKNDYKTAEPYYQDAIAISTQVLGKDNLVYAQDVFSLATLKRFSGEYASAEPLYHEAISIQERLAGRESLAYIKSLEGLGSLYIMMEDYLKAVQYLSEAKSLREKLFDRPDKDYALTINKLARAFRQQGDFDKAIVLDEEALAAWGQLVETTNPYYLGAINSLAIDYFDKGDYRKVEQIHLNAKQIQEEARATETQAYAWTLNNLANAYWKLGDYEQAEQYHLQAKDLRERLLGKEHLDYAASLMNLANLYFEIGDYEKSVSLNQSALAIVGKIEGRQSQSYATIANNLGNCYWKMAKLDLAEQMHLEAKAIREKVLGKAHIDYSGTLLNLGNLYYDKGEYLKAEQYHLEAKAIQEKILGPEHPDYPWNLIDLANIYWQLGDLQQAEKLNLEAKDRWAKSLGCEHPFYVACIDNLAELYTEIGLWDKAEPLYDSLFVLDKLLINKSLCHLSEREMNAYLRMFSGAQNRVLYVAGECSGRISKFPGMCYDNAVFFKGLLLCSTQKIRAVALSDTVLAKKIDRLKSWEARLAQLYCLPSAERDSAKAATTQNEIELLQKQINQGVTKIAGELKPVTWKEISAALHPDEAAIEFVSYQPLNTHSADSVWYAALVLTPALAAPRFISLCEGKALNTLLQGATGGNNFLKINALYASPALYNLVWKPLESSLKGVHTVYYAASGLLHRINLSAIATPEGQAYGRSRHLVALGSTRQLALKEPSWSGKQDAFLVGGVRYEEDRNAMVPPHKPVAQGGKGLETPHFQPDSLGILRGNQLEYLPATAIEVREISETLQVAGFQVQADTGYYATEDAFRQLGVNSPSPRIIHLATHGYFFPDPAVNNKKILPGARASVYKLSDHPMIRSGLLLAGAKQAWLTGKHPEGQEDGILTAYEISQMNLRNTELVVLSACETGLGDIVGNEGVYGLQRAFKIAGARYLIMSLWKVGDQSTRAFMTTFYRHWLKDGQTVPQAFRRTQEEMRAKYTGAYDWAGFVLIE